MNPRLRGRSGTDGGAEARTAGIPTGITDDGIDGCIVSGIETRSQA